MSRKDRATGETETGATCSGATLGGSHQALKSLRRVGNTHSFAPDRPRGHRDEETGLPGRPCRGLWSQGRTGAVCTKAEGFRSGVTPKLGKGWATATVTRTLVSDT